MSSMNCRSGLKLVKNTTFSSDEHQNSTHLLNEIVGEELPFNEHWTLFAYGRSKLNRSLEFEGHAHLFSVRETSLFLALNNQKSPLETDTNSDLICDTRLHNRNEDEKSVTKKAKTRANFGINIS